MSDLIWINGEIIPMAEARIGVEDRGFQFADGVYEVIRVFNKKPFAIDPHLKRLENSAKGIELALPCDSTKLKSDIVDYLAGSPISEGMIYLQLTRGCAPRNHAFPKTGPTLLFYARQLTPLGMPGTGPGAKLITVADERWKRCWIKSIALLPNVLAKNLALSVGADEAVFVEDEVVTECSSSNIFAVVGRRVLTHPVGSKVLPGITRAILIDLAPTLGLEIQERPFREDEALKADEIFITSTTREISWVSHWNDRQIAIGKCGGITVKLHRAIRERTVRETA